MPANGMETEKEDLSELIPMRDDERIDPVLVGRFLEGRLPDAEGVPEVEQFAGGRANLTYLLRYPGREYVLRRPPLGPVAPKSHDMGREYRVLSVLHSAYPLAPRAYLYSEQSSVVGAPFLVMERRKGLVIRREMPPGVPNRPELYRRIGEALVDALADLHAVDPGQLGLNTLGRPEGFVERQVLGWYRRWEGAKTEEVAEIDAVLEWLKGAIPEPVSTALVHGDFKLDNMMVDASDPSRPVAVFDWDMCTLGDPLIDLGALLAYWAEAGDSENRSLFRVMPTHLPGFPTRREIVDRYARRSGLAPDHIRFYEIFALFRLAVVVQQIYVRWFRGQTEDERFSDYGSRVAGLARAAYDEISR